MKAIVLAALLATAACAADAVGNTYPNYPALSEAVKPLPELKPIDVLGLQFFSLGRTEHFESDPSTSDQARNTDGKFIYPPKDSWFFGVFKYDNPKFLETNVYYHLTRAHEFAVHIGAHEVDEKHLTYDVWQKYEPSDDSSHDNAYFSSNDYSLHFDQYNPHFKVHPGLDASVVYHEYGHYVERILSPRYSNTGSRAEILEARGVGEGFGDFFANALTGNPEQGVVFCGNRSRNAANTLTYKDIYGKEVHTQGQVFSGMAWDMRLKLGADVAQKLVIAGVRAARAPVTFRNAMTGILVADFQLYAGAHVADLKQIFAARGIDPTISAEKIAQGLAIVGQVAKKALHLIPGL